jgi:hypothetical protein
VVRLFDELEAIAGAGLVVDRVIGSISADQFQNMQLGESKQTEYIRLESLFTLLPQLERSPSYVAIRDKIVRT